MDAASTLGVCSWTKLRSGLWGLNGPVMRPDAAAEECEVAGEW